MTDLRNAQECHNLIVESLKYFPKLNSLVNSAAVTSRGTIDNTSTELWEEHMNICLLYTSPSPRDQRGSGMPCWG